jgi:hypothetical protein
VTAASHGPPHSVSPPLPHYAESALRRYTDFAAELVAAFTTWHDDDDNDNNPNPNHSYNYNHQQHQH